MGASTPKDLCRLPLMAAVLLAGSPWAVAGLHRVAQSGMALGPGSQAPRLRWHTPNLTQEALRGAAGLHSGGEVYFYGRVDRGQGEWPVSLFRWNEAAGLSEEIVGGGASSPALMHQRMVCNEHGDVVLKTWTQDAGAVAWRYDAAAGVLSRLGEDITPFELTDSGHMLLEQGECTYLVSPTNAWVRVSGATGFRDPDTGVLHEANVSLHIATDPGYAVQRHVSDDRALGAEGGYRYGGMIHGGTGPLYSQPADYTEYSRIDRDEDDAFYGWEMSFAHMLGTGEMILLGAHFDQGRTWVCHSPGSLEPFQRILPVGHFVDVEGLADPVLISWLYDFADGGTLLAEGRRAWSERDGVYVRLPDGRWFEAARAGDTVEGFGTLGMDFALCDVAEDGTALFAASLWGDESARVLLRWQMPEPTGLALLALGGLGLVPLRGRRQ